LPLFQTQPFHLKLAEELADGIYAKAVFSGLNEIDANEKETLIIDRILKGKSYNSVQLINCN
jgi:hypothetical protein